MVKCPRCQRSASYPTFDTDTFGCYSCGEVRFGKPLDMPLLYVKPHTGGKKKKEKVEPSLCIDCKAVISTGAKRCPPCAMKVVNAGLKKAGKKNGFGARTISPRRHDFVASPRGTGL